MKTCWAYRVIAGILLVAAGLGMPVAGHLAARPAVAGVLGLSKVFAFTYTPGKDFDPKQLKSVTLFGPANAADWKYWQGRGVVEGVGHAWFDLLRTPLDKAVENLTGTDFGGNPHPVVMIDEFGFDYGGNLDQKSAQVLRQAKLKKPDLALTVFQMREPLPQVLGEAYRDAADLVMFESYVHSQRDYWWIATQVWSARKYGVLPKSIFILGLGKGGNPGENWADTPAELEEQMRFLRLIAPESPGVGFFAGNPELLASADALCAHYFEFPTDGSGLPAEVREVADTYSHHYEKPTIIASPSLVGPDYNENGSGALAEPKTMRAYLINLGDADAHEVKVRLRNVPMRGGNVFAEGVAPLVPGRGKAVAVLKVTDKWFEWVGQWIVEVDAPGCDVRIFKP